MQATEEMQWFKEAITMDYEEPLGKALSALQKSKTCIVITRDNKYYGILDDRHIRQLASYPSVEKAGSEAIRAPTIALNMPAVDICKLFFTDHYKALPVVQKEKVVGIITRADLLKILLDGGEIGKRRVEEIMSSPPLYIEENATMIQARALMRSENVKRLVVTKNGSFIGIVSTYDIGKLNKPKEKAPFLSEKVAYAKHPISSFMRSDVLTVEPDESVINAAKLMADNEISALIVAENNRPVGVLTATDVFETVLTGEKENIWLVGLPEEDKEYAQDIIALCKNTLSKIAQSFKIESLTLHVKKHGRKYSVRARVNHGTVTSLSNYGWELKQTVRKVLAEIKKVLEKGKPNRMHTRTGLEE
ncbi:CBS domain-containing protein [Candidatus Micrarchaeota archaeon]|nr:CBS domain-containing protein [Candidatus Micrarchaeota archaeon]